MKLFLSLLLSSICINVSAQLVFPGEPAPSIRIGKWVKGTPVEKFEKDKIYIVEFWATWCGPCKESIPHLTEIAEKYKDIVSVIGVSVAEMNTAEVEPFVKKMGDKMNYIVAVDQQKNATSRTGYMSQHWLEAAEQYTIPSSFIIGKTGHIEWIGQPGEMDKVLEKVIAGTWNAKDYVKQWKKEQRAKMR
jgi:thiol-disulfide isomerase/thioredoxin